MPKYSGSSKTCKLIKSSYAVPKSQMISGEEVVLVMVVWLLHIQISGDSPDRGTVTCGVVYFFFPFNFLPMAIKVSPVLLSMLSLKGGTCLNSVPSVMSACPVWWVKRLRAGASTRLESVAVVVSHFSIVFSKVCTDMVSSLSFLLGTVRQVPVLDRRLIRY